MACWIREIFDLGKINERREKKNEGGK